MTKGSLSDPDDMVKFDTLQVDIKTTEILRLFKLNKMWSAV